MKVLELFAGTRSIGKAFERAGHEVFTIEIDPSFENISWCADIMKVTAEDILEKFGRPDIIWASPRVNLIRWRQFIIIERKTKKLENVKQRQILRNKVMNQ